ncbi:MAG: hypothetical protein SWY16_13765 [Cyanobacteriota bacterium]|nr:hypothetical protein [Cyanobacteriota bacterium]
MNDNLINDFGKLSLKFEEEWKQINNNKLLSADLIAQLVGKWTRLEKTTFLANKIYEIFLTYHQDFEGFKPENKEEIKKKVTSYLKQDKYFLQCLRNFNDQIISNKKCLPNKLVEVLSNILDEEDLQWEEYETELGELEAIRIIRYDLSKQEVTVHQIYQDALNLDDILQKIREKEENVPQSKLESEQSSKEEIASTPTNGLQPFVKLTQILFTAAIPIFVLGFCVYRVTQPRIEEGEPTQENPSPELDIIQQSCEQFRPRLRDINLAGREEIVEKRDLLIQDIDEFLQTHNDRSLDRICNGSQLDSEFADVLYRQAFRLANSGDFGESTMIRSDGSLSEYGAVRSLCLIPEDLLNSEAFQDPPKEKMTEWRAGEQGEVVEAELGKIESCPAASP